MISANDRWKKADFIKRDVRKRANYVEEPWKKCKFRQIIAKKTRIPLKDPEKQESRWKITKNTNSVKELRIKREFRQMIAKEARISVITEGWGLKKTQIS